MRSISPTKAYRLLESGPVVLVTTAHEGRANVMTMGFHMMVCHAPPLIGAVIGPWDHSLNALRATGECVLAIPGRDLAEKVVDIGNCSGDTVDKFKRFRLTAVPASMVAAPLIGECLANIECRISDDTLAARHNLYILEAVAIALNDDRRERHTLHHNGDGTFMVAGRRLDLRQRMVRWKEFQVDL